MLVCTASSCSSVWLAVANTTSELLAGAYAEVHLDVPATQQVFILSIQTLLFRSEGLQVATVTSGRVALKPVSPGRDFGDRKVAGDDGAGA